MFGTVKLTKHPDTDQYKYSGYDIGFDRERYFILGHEIGRNLIIFGVDMSSSPYIDNNKKDILILGKDPTKGLEHILSTEKLYSINFTKHNTKFCLKSDSPFQNKICFICFINSLFRKMKIILVLS